jgi:hypothetical protein
VGGGTTLLTVRVFTCCAGSQGGVVERLSRASNAGRFQCGAPPVLPAVCGAVPVDFCRFRRRRGESIFGNDRDYGARESHTHIHCCQIGGLNHFLHVQDVKKGIGKVTSIDEWMKGG